MNINATASALVPLLGGRENIASAAHCATRLRLVLVDDKKIDKAAIEKLDGAHRFKQWAVSLIDRYGLQFQIIHLMG